MLYIIILWWPSGPSRSMGNEIILGCPSLFWIAMYTSKTEGLWQLNADWPLREATRECLLHFEHRNIIGTDNGTDKCTDRQTGRWMLQNTQSSCFAHAMLHGAEVWSIYWMLVYLSNSGTILHTEWINFHFDFFPFRLHCIYKNMRVWCNRIFCNEMKSFWTERN